MVITLYNTYSEKNMINKSLVNALNFEGTLRSETSIINPVFNIESSTNLVDYNYCYIQEFGRYYFIKDIRSIRNNLWEISLQVDVLMSFRNDILNSEGIIIDTENVNSDMYQNHDSWNTKVKTKTDIISFPSGLLESGEYILITAGG